MESKTISSSTRGGHARNSQAYTLLELVFGIGIASLMLTVIVGLSISSAINFACLAKYSELDSWSINAMGQLSRDIRQANGVTAISTNSLTLQTDSGVPITYSYSSTTRTLTRIEGAASTLVLPMCDNLKFLYYQRTPIRGTFDQYDIGGTNEVKVIFVTWSCSRTIFGNKLTTDSASVGRMVMRVN